MAIKKRITSIFFLSVILVSSLIIAPASAKRITVVAKQDDVFQKLQDAAMLNVIMNNLIKCFNAGSTYNYTSGGLSALSGSSIKSGKVFKKPGSSGITNTDHSTSLWLEDAIQGNGGDDGAIWCWQGQDEGNGLLQLYQEITEQSYAEIVCNEGKGRIFQRAKYEYSYSGGYYGGGTGWYAYVDDTNCSSLSDTGAVYLLKSDWKAGLEASYNAYRASSDNQYLPLFSDIGKYNNIDGYFNYLKDYNLKCSADIYDSKPDSTTVYPLTSYERTETKIVARTKYYHVTENKTWANSLSADNAVKSCTGLLERMSTLETQYNGVYDSDSTISTNDDRLAGYEGIILAKLKTACNNLKDEEGNPAYETLLTKFQETLDSEDATEEMKATAQEGIDKINAAKTKGTFVTVSGTKTSSEGQTFQCLDVEGLALTLDEYQAAIDWENTVLNNANSEPTCYDGAGSLGWILCPLLESTGKAVTFLYEKVIEPYLQINVELFSGTAQEKDAATGAVVQQAEGSVGAWSVFRDISNLALIVFFLVILFSQITGFGIDNYGIKKLLPKIIVTAVLINLSYIICQLAVDLSNILGYNLKHMMDLMAESITLSDTAEYTRGYSAAGNVISTLVPILTVGIAALAIWAEGLIAVALAVLVAVISALVGIFFVFALLSVRQAGVILLVVISPAAMVCYMLPNTKSLFNKWLKAFQGLLLLYPICGLLIGAGNFASKILLSTGAGANDFFVALSAMLINIVPFFFIPTLLKGCFAAMGNIGARISGLGKGISGQAKSRINNSGVARRGREQRAEYHRMRRAGVKYDEKGNLVLTKRGQRQNAKADSGKMSVRDRTRLNAERASLSKNATSSNKYLGADAEGQLALDRTAQEQRDRRSTVDDMILSMQGGAVSYDEAQPDGTVKPQKIDVHDAGSMQKALTHYIKSGKGNEAQIQALTKMLSQQGDSGRKAVRESMEAALAGDGDLDASAVRAYSTAIMDDFSADYKNNARTTWEFAKNNQTIADGSTSSLSMPTKVDPETLKAATIGTIDDGELERVVSTYESGSLSQEKSSMITRAAYDALHSESGASIKEGNRTKLQKLADRHIVKTMDCAALDTAGNPVAGSHERISLRGDGKYVNEQGAVVKISSYKVIE